MSAMLKDCPNCGATGAELHRSRHGHHYVVCPRCWTKSVPCSTAKAAVRMWNDRHGRIQADFIFSDNV